MCCARCADDAGDRLCARFATAAALPIKWVDGLAKKTWLGCR